MNEPIRAFLAVDLSEEIRDKLVSIKRLLAETGAAVRWVRDDGLHVTVKFLGEVAPATLDRLREALTQRSTLLRPFVLQVRGLGTFPGERQPRVVWAGAEASELPQLAQIVEETAASFGFAPERRPFRPHVTLGRVKSTRGWPRLHEQIAAHRHDVMGGCEITGLVGYRSDLHRDGAIYTKLWTIGFGESM